MDLELNEEELKAINLYRNDKYLSINQFLSQDVESDISLIMSGENLDYSQKSVIENIEIIKRMSVALIKKSEVSSKEWVFYRVVNISEINRLKAERTINRFLLASNTEEKAKFNMGQNISKYAMMQLYANDDIPYIILNENIDEIVISPFLEIESIEENIDVSYNDFIRYKVFLRKQKMEKISDEEEGFIFNNIINNADIANQKLKECVRIEEENIKNFENIRKLEQLLAKHNLSMEQENYEKDNSDIDKQAVLDDIDRINTELATQKAIAIDMFDKRKENLFFISNWKKDIIKYIMIEIEKLKNSYNSENTDINVSQVEEDDVYHNNEEINDKMYEKENKVVKNELNKDEEKIIEIKELDPEVLNVKKEAQENIAVVNTLLDNIKNLIYKQQNHARIAELLNSNYKALNNAFEMKNYATELEVLVNGISNKVDTLTKDNTIELQKISKTNLQVSTLLNYLNNPKSAVSKKINRFEELNILEENELKREIAETIKNIRCEAELKKLRDDLSIIKETSGFKKFIGRFTGKNKLNEAMVEQIGIRENAIKRTFKLKMPLAQNYSIHNMIAEIEMFIEDNKDDELVIEDVNNLRNIRDNLKKNFVIIDSRVVSIIDQKTGKYLPYDSRKVSKKDLIEIDTYRFLKKYGYDRPVKNDEPEYQDTLSREIKRIVDYIKTSDVLVIFPEN